MQCPLCQADNPPSADHCTKCSTPLPLADMTMPPPGETLGGTLGGTMGGTQAWSVAVTPRPSSEAAAKGQLEAGFLLAERFEIVSLLGQGGMGAVYKARDTELERLVAIKLIRPELASHPEILRRFKQELILAREVTHRNVIRIFDLGQAQGIKFITMEFVEGRDLRGLIHEKGKLTVDEAVPIILQISAALDAAHTAGVVHRDLKPQNVMSDKDGRVYVMDFGIARSLESQGMTQTGALMGTPEYMSPEQAKGEKVDARSDLFALGIIFYEALTGISPFKAETAMAMMFKRTQEKATPLVQLDLGVPGVISDIVAKCLEIKPAERYQTAREVINDLEAFTGGAQRGTIIAPSRRISDTPAYQKWLVIGGIVVVLGAGGWFIHDRVALRPSGSSAGPVQPVSLAILPFRNTSNDPSIDWVGNSVANILSTDVGQSAYLHTVSSDRVFQILKDLHIPANADFDPDTVRRIAENSNADILVWGRYAKFGDQIRIDGTLQDRKHDRTVPLRIDVPSEKDFPKTMDQFAELVRSNLSVSSDVLKELKASSFQPTSESVAALRDYNQSLQLIREGKNLDAIKGLQGAIKEDPQFALAFSRLAEIDLELGYDSDAERNSRRAVELSDQLPKAEKYLIQANHWRVMKDPKKAIEAYENLAKSFPQDADVLYALGSLYVDQGDYAKAQTAFQDILKTDPKNIKALWQLGTVAFLQDNPQGALTSLNQGLSYAVQYDNQEQKALILQALGISYRHMNKPEEAMKNFQDSMEISRKLGLKRLLANSLSETAQIQITMGKPDAAMASYNQGLQILKEIGIKKDYGDILINRGVLYESRGELDKALQDYKDALQIERDANDENYMAVCLSNIGYVYFAKGDLDNSLIYYQQSLALREKLNQPVYLTETLSALGDVYSSMGDYDKALQVLLRAQDVSRKANDARAAAGVSVLVGNVLNYEGRVGAAISAMQDSVNGYRSANNQSIDMVDALNGLGGAFALAGRPAESGKPLDEARNLAKDLKSDAANSELLNTQGDVAFYSGDLKAARGFYEQAAGAAARAKDRDKATIARLNLGRVSVAEGKPAAPDLKAAIQQADSQHLTYYALRGSVDLADATIKSKDYAQARQLLENDQTRSEKLGTRIETARIHFLLGEVTRLGGDPRAATGQYGQAMRSLDDLKKEAGAEHLLDRADLKAIYAEASKQFSFGGA
ncbi:MAG TPA: tetratricopeptide repeat protein [Candidatus Eremiobacteraceae bacterium]|jgi:serine/threonine protein kinase/Tfp pilus assembly protein PilF|nr:tetratricopeptide repeat protein [Candidatus Eremiobacteraceae bacterium]